MALWWTTLRTSFWILPGIMILFAILVARIMEWLDATFGQSITLPWPQISSPGAAREVLSTIASSMITVAGVTFSIVIVALAAAANQYSPRVLRTFVRDRPNQVVLGVFLGIFTYCILVLTSIEDGDAATVPQLSMLVALILTLLSVAFLVYFIHHIAGRIQVSNICREISRETLAVVKDLYSEDLERGTQDSGQTTDLSQICWYPIAALDTGYIQTVDEKLLLVLASEHDLLIRMDKGVGEYVFRDQCLISVSRPCNDQLHKRLHRAFAINTYRNVDQDVEFGIRQLVDIALRALSPGINDTTTAQTCISYLTEILAALVRRRLCRTYGWHGNQLRLIRRGPTFPALLDVAVAQIRLNAAQNPQVLVHLLDALATVGEFSSDRARLGAIRQQAQRIAALASNCSPNPDDCDDVSRHARDTLAALALRCDQLQSPAGLAAK